MENVFNIISDWILWRTFLPELQFISKWKNWRSLAYLLILCVFFLGQEIQFTYSARTLGYTHRETYKLTYTDACAHIQKMILLSEFRNKGLLFYSLIFTELSLVILSKNVIKNNLFSRLYATKFSIVSR